MMRPYNRASLLHAGIAQLVEHDLAKVGVASSSLVSRSIFCTARWQNGYAAACKAVYAGSIPTLASNMPFSAVRRRSEKFKKHRELWGLYLLVAPTGGRLWRFKYLSDGREKLISLGS
jgi:hypothetical protein